ncbi:molybdenum cofactor guanylyltransferase [Cellulomonas sp. PhB143]|uniref:molybdenum cofactor guanylyltransferase n=1 Tax=Cellulomonas sp. PhB143 TaxID=2485186 RepID=UPI000FAC92CA|nr:NTP transferase domain-containing protein [Cellulomonas sp. PhB143]ROS76581.1 molybdopterin-guanine dinucleotide biosynthesis protein A [Cellulomonas sp. PhB143]
MTDHLPEHDAVVLAGGRATRLGTPKPGLLVAGVPLLDHVLRATSAAGRTVVVGPDDVARPGVLVAREDPPFGGPVAATGAGLESLETLGRDGRAARAWVLLLACDVPDAADAVPGLLGWAASPGAEGYDGAHLVLEGRDQWLVGVYRRGALRDALDRVRAGAGTLTGASVRGLLGHLRLRGLDDATGASRDIDTPADLALHGGTRPALHRRTRHESADEADPTH